MQIVDLKEKLNMNQECFYNVILVTGPWGVGKTYFVKKYLKEKKYIYLSAFGIKDIEELKYGLYHELNKYNAWFLKKMRSLYGNNFGILGVSIPIPNVKVDLETSIKRNIKKKKKNKDLVIVIDDFERKNNSLEMKELLGFAESLSQVEGIKIIIIANDEKLEGKDQEIFHDFKEKVVKRIYNIDAISEDSINDIIKEKYNKNIFGNYLKLNEYKKLTIEFFNNHNVNNLRTLQKAILFSNEVVANIGNQMEKENIIELIKVCLAVVIEENDKLYLNEELNKDLKQKDYISDLYTQEDYCILKHYFSEGISYSSKVDLIRPIINIFNTIDEENSYNSIYTYFKLKNSPITKNKELFLCSKKQIEDKIKDFKNKKIKEKDNTNLMDWFRELNQLYPWIERLDLNVKLEDKEIIDAMDMYIDTIDYSRKLYDLIEHHFEFEIENNKIKELYKIVNLKIATNYLNKVINDLEEKTKQEIYNHNMIHDFFETINNSYLVSKEIHDIIMKKVYTKNFFIPKLDDEIDEEKWRFAHAIWKFASTFIEKNREMFIESVKKELEKTNELGKYRINSLNRQYHIDVI